MSDDRGRDPIDELIPAHRPWWVRLLVGGSVVVAVGVVAALVGFGYIYPEPECCGGGAAPTHMSLASEGGAVTVQVPLFNSSGRDLIVTRVESKLPGARVLDVAFAGSSERLFPPADAEERAGSLPGRIPGTDWGRILVTFVPERCHLEASERIGTKRTHSERRVKFSGFGDSSVGSGWGNISVQLDVANGALPSIRRWYALPEAVAGATSRLELLGARDPEVDRLRDPLAAACALLGRSDGPLGSAARR